MSEDLLHILHKVSGLYQQYGIRSITMDDIANELAISKKTLYQYVKDKNELVRRVVEMELAERSREFSRLIDKCENAIDELIKVNHWILNELKNHNPSIHYDLKKYYPELYSEMLGNKRMKMFNSIRDNLKRGIDEGIFRQEIDIDIISKMLIHWIECMHESEILTTDDFRDPMVYNQIFKYHIHGITNNEGRKIIDQYMAKDKLIEKA